MSARVAVFSAAFAAAVGGAAAAPPGPAAEGLPDRTRYDEILRRAPFGAPPPTAGAEADAAAPGGPGGAPAASAAPAVPAASPVRLQSLSLYGGVPAAGFVEVGAGRTFLLREGEELGAYRLLAADVELGRAVLAAGTNVFTVSIAWAPGQATNVVPSARAPFLTGFRPDWTEAAVPAPTPAAAPAPVAAAPEPVAPTAEAAARRGRSAALSPEEEAALRRRATIVGEDGAEHLSFRELQRLRAERLAEKAAEARAQRLAEEAERRAAEKAAADARLAAERAAADERAEAERRRRAAVVQALAQGYDVEVDFTLTADEAQTLRDAGYDVPEDVLAGRATLGGGVSPGDAEDEE